jgi:hypothetical protein
MLTLILVFHYQIGGRIVVDPQMDRQFVSTSACLAAARIEAPKLRAKYGDAQVYCDYAELL